jgi:hypothetical protein
LLEVRRVETRKERIAFIKMQWSIYRDDPHWVPPIIADQVIFLDPRKGVFFDHGQAALLMAFRNGVPVGSISAHVNRLHDERYQDGKGFFGFFECENNPQTAAALFSAAETFLKGSGRTCCERPMSFGIYDEIGILVKGFDSDPYLQNVHNPEYYQDLIVAAGYEKSIDWFAYRTALDRYLEMDKKLFEVRERALRRTGLSIRRIGMGRFHEEAAILEGPQRAALSPGLPQAFKESQKDRSCPET